MFSVGDVVRLLPPFNDSFPGTYPIVSVNDDGICRLKLMESDDPDNPDQWLTDFDPKFLETA